MNVSLTPELDRFVAAKVESGRYNSASEVVREALRLLEEYDRTRASQLAAFNQELGTRLASLDHGEHVAGEDARTRLEQKSRNCPDLRGAMRGTVTIPPGADLTDPSGEIWDAEL
jgi:antitoxin ParD1/3/4